MSEGASPQKNPLKTHKPAKHKRNQVVLGRVWYRKMVTFHIKNQCGYARLLGLCFIMCPVSLALRHFHRVESRLCSQRRFCHLVV